MSVDIEDNRIKKAISTDIFKDESDWLSCGTAAKLCKGRVLDICCGRGGCVLIASSLGLDAYGVDSDENNIKTAQIYAQRTGLDRKSVV